MRKIQAHILSLGNQLREVVLIEERSNSDVEVLYEGGLFQACYNPFDCSYYVDDVYGIIE